MNNFLFDKRSTSFHRKVPHISLDLFYHSCQNLTTFVSICSLLCSSPQQSIVLYGYNVPKQKSWNASVISQKREHCWRGLVHRNITNRRSNQITSSTHILQRVFHNVSSQSRMKFCDTKRNTNKMFHGYLSSSSVTTLFRKPRNLFRKLKQTFGCQGLCKSYNDILSILLYCLTRIVEASIFLPDIP